MPMSPRLLRPLASGAFSPRQISGLSIWMDAADSQTVTLDGSGNVEAWGDKSGAGLVASQATPGARPIYSNTQNGRSVVTFDGTDDFLRSGLFAEIPQPFEVYSVFRYESAFSATTRVLELGTSALRAGEIMETAENRIDLFSGGVTTLQAADVSDLRQYNILRARYQGASSEVGTPQGYLETGAAGTNGATQLTLANNRIASGASNTSIAEVLVYTRVLSLAERQKVEGWLAWRWGLQAQLPSNHPYAYSFPGFGSQARPDNGDALAWESAVYANSGSVSVGTLAAVNTFCNAIDAASIRDRFYRLSLMCGDSDASLVAVRTPLYRGPSLGGTQYGNALDTNNNFVQGDYAETGATGGLKGNGSSKYLDTGLQSDALPVPGVGHLSAWGRDQTTGRSGWLSSFGASFTNQTQIEYNQSDGNTFFGWGREQTILTTPGTVSHLLVSRGSSTDQRAYHDGSLAGTNTVSTSMSGNSAALTVLARNVDGSLGAYSDGRINSYSIGDNMSGTQVTAFYNALNTFLTTLGRT